VISNKLQQIQELYDIVNVIDLDNTEDNYIGLQKKLQECYKEKYHPNERIVVTSTKDYYNKNDYGILLKSLQLIVNKVDISNCFIVFITTNEDIDKEYNYILKNYSTDETSFEIVVSRGQFNRLNANNINELSLYKLTDKSIDDYTQTLLQKSNFCIMPWIQTEIHTTGKVYPCCFFKRDQPLGDSKTTSLADIFNNDNFKNLRKDILSNKEISGCETCKKYENHNKQSFRESFNKDHFTHIKNVKNTASDGYYPYKHISWNLWFDNLCNLKCRTCNPTLSTSWYSDAIKLGDIKEEPQRLTSADVLDQHLEHIDVVENIYFSGGEPILIETYWKILDELIKRDRTDVKLVYNTNLSSLTLKNKNIIDYWEKFSTVHVGASLDAMGDRANYWRSGTIWKDVEKNRRELIKRLPNLGFSVDCTISLVNAIHAADFHRNWVENELIEIHQFNPKILFYPYEFSLQQAPGQLKDKIKDKIIDHLEWIDKFNNRNTNIDKTIDSYNAILDELNKEHKFQKEQFWEKINKVDKLRNESLLKVFNELTFLK